MPATFFAASSTAGANGSRLWNWYLVLLTTTRSASIWRTIASEDSKKPRSKPSCTSISSTAKPMPALERIRRRLFDKRLRSASGTRRPPPVAIVCDAVTIAGSENLGRVGPAQPAQRQKGRDRRHHQRDAKDDAEF